MVNVLPSYTEFYSSGHGKGPAYARQIQASRSRIDTYLRQLLENGLRNNDAASSEEMALRTQLYSADGALKMVEFLAESKPELLEKILKATRTDLLRFEALGRMDIIFPSSKATATQNSDQRSESMSY